MGFEDYYTGLGTKYLVKCIECGWKGYRKDSIECCCYDEYAFYCRPGTPGPGCPRGILWPCPKKCGLVEWKKQGYSKVVIVREVLPKEVNREEDTTTEDREVRLM